MVIVKDPSNYLNGLFVKSEKVTELKILSEADYKEGAFGKKLEFKVKCNDKAQTEKQMSLNNTNHSMLMKIFSPDTKDWVDQTVSVATVFQQTPGGMKDVIYIGDKV